jgi:hypothetical protein
MPWFYVDDGFSDSKPVLDMPDRYRLAACGLWTLAGSWSAKEELDGFVPDSKLKTLGARPPILAALTEPGPMSAPLCVRVEGGIQFNSWGKWQKTRADLKEKRREDAERQRAWREAHPDAKKPSKVRGRNALTSADANSSQRDMPVTEDVTDSVTNAVTEDVSRCDASRAPACGPDPTRPDPTQDLSGYVESAAYESDATRERDDLSPPVNIGATRLVEVAIPPNAVNAATRTGLRIEASQLLGAGETETDVAECLRLWLTKPDLGVKALKSLMAEVYKSRNPANSKPVSKLRGWAELAQQVRAEELSQLETASQPKELM